MGAHGGGSVNYGLWWRRQPPSSVHLCAFTAAKAKHSLPESTRFSKRATSPRPQPPLPWITSPRNPLVYSLGLKRLLTHCDCCLRANWRPDCFLRSSRRFFPKSPCRPSRPRVGEAGGAERCLGPAGTRPGTETGKGPVPSGTGARRSAEICTPQEAQRKTQTRRAPSSQSPGRQRQRWSPGSAATTRALTRAGAARSEGLRSGARLTGALSGPGPACQRPGRCHYLASVVFPEPGRPRRR